LCLLEFFCSDVDFEAQERSAHGFAQVIEAQIACTATLQSAVQHELHGQNVGQRPSVHLTREPWSKVRLNSGRRDFAFQKAIARLVPGKQAKVHPVGFVAATGVGDASQVNFQKGCGHAPGSNISTRA